MRWLIHGNLTKAALDALVRHGHHVHAPEELGVGPAATPLDIIKAAREKQWDIATSDAGFVNAIYDQHLFFNRSIVFLHLAGGDVEQDDAIDRLFQRYKRLSPGRLYTLTETRVKIRQLPQRTRPEE